MTVESVIQEPLDYSGFMHMCIVPVLGRQKQKGHCEFKVSLFYVERSGSNTIT